MMGPSLKLKRSASMQLPWQYKLPNSTNYTTDGCRSGVFDVCWSLLGLWTGVLDSMCPWVAWHAMHAVHKRHIGNV
jgi:hypothetical protein